MKRMKLDVILYHIQKTTWIKDLHKTSKFQNLSRKHRESLLDTDLGNGFFGCDTKSISDKS